MLQTITTSKRNAIENELCGMKIIMPDNNTTESATSTLFAAREF